MADDRLIKISGRTPEAVCERFDISEDAKALLEPGMTSERFLAGLTEAGHFSDAAFFLAHALPKREAVWWGCLSVRSAGEAALDEESTRVLNAAALWVRDPSDENRRAAMQAAQESGLDKPASLVGVAAFMSGDTIGLPDTDPVPPPDTVAGTMVASAVMLMAVTPDPASADERYRQFIANGMEIAGGRPASG